MKGIILILFMLTPLAMADENWYQLTVDRADDEYTYLGIIDMPIDELLDSMDEEGFLKISNLVYFDDGVMRSYKDWRDNFEDTAYIRKRGIIEIIPLLSPPHIASRSSSDTE